MSKIGLVWSVSLLVTLVSADLDFKFTDDNYSLMPGVRRSFRGRSERAPSDTPIFFPGADIPEEPVRGTEEVDTRSDGKLDLPMEVDELDMNLLSRINSITNISDFASLFDLELPQAKSDIFAEGEVALRVGISSQEPESFDMANCKPELVTVPLDLPKEAGTMFFPTCIRLEQCGGCCIGPQLKCRPSVTKVVKVKVLKVSSAPANSNGGGRGRGRVRGGSRRRRRQSQQSYHIAEAVKHTACECGCRVQEEDCHSDLHTYFEGECACICKNKDEQSKCEQQNSTKYWDNDSCNCFCRKELECSTGEYFSHNSCRCERLTARHGIIPGPNGVGNDRTRRRRKPVRVPLI